VKKKPSQFWLLNVMNSNFVLKGTEVKVLKEVRKIVTATHRATFPDITADMLKLIKDNYRLDNVNILDCTNDRTIKRSLAKRV
jgi:hypothetical protein